jgi:hypothetical protein
MAASDSATQLVGGQLASEVGHVTGAGAKLRSAITTMNTIATPRNSTSGVSF